MISNPTFEKQPFSEVQAKLEVKAPDKEYILYDVGNNWLVINAYFLQKIHLQMLQCNKEEKLVMPLQNEMMQEQPQPWYKSDTILIAGIPVIFSTGVALGLFLR